MKKDGLLLLMIFCLGFFIMPKQNLHSQNNQSIQCCEQSSSDASENNCCDDEEDHSSKGCQDTDCTTCHTCYNFLSLVFVNFEKKTDPSANPTYRNQNFFYKSPAFSSTARDIWQPPKIG